MTSAAARGDSCWCKWGEQEGDRRLAGWTKPLCVDVGGSMDAGVYIMRGTVAMG